MYVDSARRRLVANAGLWVGNQRIVLEPQRTRAGRVVLQSADQGKGAVARRYRAVDSRGIRIAGGKNDYRTEHFHLVGVHALACCVAEFVRIRTVCECSEFS